MRKVERITKNIQNDKELMNLIENESYTSVESFIENAQRYIKAIKTGRMVCVIESVSKSGTSRNMKFLSCDKRGGTNNYSYCTYWTLFKHLGFTPVKNGGAFRIGGCGMDMVFYTNYTIMHKLCRLGFISKKQCDVLAQQTPTQV